VEVWWQGDEREVLNLCGYGDFECCLGLYGRHDGSRRKVGEVRWMFLEVVSW